MTRPVCKRELTRELINENLLEQVKAMLRVEPILPADAFCRKSDVMSLLRTLMMPMRLFSTTVAMSAYSLNALAGVLPHSDQGAKGDTKEAGRSAQQAVGSAVVKATKKAVHLVAKKKVVHLTAKKTRKVA